MIRRNKHEAGLSVVQQRGVALWALLCGLSRVWPYWSLALLPRQELIREWLKFITSELRQRLPGTGPLI